MKKEETTEEDLMFIVNLLEDINIKYWIDGGWGVDILFGKQTRPHRDIDIDFDSKYMNKLLEILFQYGYKIDTDLRPVRIELYSTKHEYLDIHPFFLNEDGTSKQANFDGGFYEFESDFFTNVKFKEKLIPCISLKGQQIFHTGYKLRDKDLHDLQILKKVLN